MKTRAQREQEQRDKWTALVQQAAAAHLKQLEEATKKAVSNWLDKVAANEESIAKYVEDELNKVVQAIIVTHLGGTSRTDYRATSIFNLVGAELEAFLKKKPQQEMLKNLIAEVLPEFVANEKKYLKMVVTEVLHTHLHSKVRYRAETLLKADLSSEFSGIDLIDKIVEDALKEQALLKDLSKENDDE